MHLLTIILKTNKWNQRFFSWLWLAQSLSPLLRPSTLSSRSPWSPPSTSSLPTTSLATLLSSSGPSGTSSTALSLTPDSTATTRHGNPMVLSRSTTPTAGTRRSTGPLMETPALKDPGPSVSHPLSPLSGATSISSPCTRVLCLIPTTLAVWPSTVWSTQLRTDGSGSEPLISLSSMSSTTTEPPTHTLRCTKAVSRTTCTCSLVTSESPSAPTPSSLQWPPSNRLLMLPSPFSITTIMGIAILFLIVFLN